MILLEISIFFIIIWLIFFICLSIFNFNFYKVEVGKIRLDLDVVFKKRNIFYKIISNFFIRNKEIKTTDDDFNEIFFISSDDKVISNMLENIIFKNAIKEIINHESVQYLEIKNKKISVSVYVKKKEKRKDILESVSFSIRECVKNIEEELNKINVDILSRDYRMNRKIINSKIIFLNNLYYSLTIATIISYFIFNQKINLYFILNEGYSDIKYIVISYLISLFLIILIYKKNKKILNNSIKKHRLITGHILGFVSIGLITMALSYMINISLDFAEKENIQIVYEMGTYGIGKSRKYYVVIKKEDNPELSILKEDINYFKINSITYKEMNYKGKKKLDGHIIKGKGFLNKEYIKIEQ